MPTDLEIIRKIEEEIGVKLKRVKWSISHSDDAYSIDARGHVTRLYLREHKIKRVPKAVFDLTHLRILSIWNQYEGDDEFLTDEVRHLKNLKELDLINNSVVKVLPPEIGHLTQMQTLTLSDNKLTVLPESLGQLTQLKTLYLDGNQLTVLPESLGQLKQLLTLALYRNQLKVLPESLGQLTKLQTLYLNYNQLTVLPEYLGQLSQLRQLGLSHNKLKSSLEFLGQFTQLLRLLLAGNKLTKLPESLDQLRNLQELDLSGNQLKEVPEWMGYLTQLQELDLSDNELTALPKSLLRCRRLKELFLHGNEVLGIPPEILGPGWRQAKLNREKEPADPRVILAWYFKSRTEPARRLNEAKMLLIGQGGVGKTSLLEYLIHNKTCNQDELPTDGINIADWNVQGKKGADGKFEKIDLHVWDFGGQEIMHATHQFFLTKRSLYLLVIDARAGEKESNIRYWLGIVQSYGGESPVLVVVNKCDQHPHELNETRLMRDFPNIRGFIQTSCTSGEGLAQLRREIGKLVRSLPHVFDELPESYFKVKTELEQKAAEKNYLPIEDYRKICRRHKVSKTENQDRLIRFLHDLGVVLNFQDPEDPFGRNDPFVLNPEWVTGGVYSIINDKELKKKRDGVLTCQKLATVLNSLDNYPENRHDFIIRKMIQFELAYQINHGKETRWLIPELLDPKEPKDLDWKPEESLNFQYAYSMLPSSVICRFIVRMHQHVDHKRSWRSGTVLRIDDTTILVRGDMEKNKVFIAVQGAVSKRKENLAIVRDAFRYVHSTIPALNPKEEVPLSDMPEVAVSYEHLLKLSKQGKMEHFPEEADRAYLVEDLLNGVDSALYRLRRRHDRIRKRQEMGEKHVFVSYCHDNKDEVARLVEDLENAGELVWWDEDILGGRDWKEAIREAMKKAYAVVVCLSPELTKQRYRSGVYPEIRDAITTFRQYGPGHAFIFPVRLEKCKVPSIEIDDTRTLERIQHIDLFPENKRAAGLQKLLKSLAEAPEHP